MSKLSPQSMLDIFVSDAVSRMAMADKKAYLSQCAFAAGKFAEYFQAEYEKQAKEIEDELAKLSDGQESDS